MYKHELKHVKSLISPLQPVADDCGVIIAGGAITSIFTASEINDVDIYFRSKEMFSAFLAGILSQELDNDYMTITHVSDRSILMTNHKGLKAQLIYYKWFETPQDVFNDFDFTVNMGAYDCKTGEFVFHEDFFKHNSQRYLKVNTNTAFPLISVLRVDKYRDKGYDISKAEMLALLMRIINLKIESWSDAISHCGGMYGIDPKDLFNQDVEFSVEEVIKQLQSLPKHKAKMVEGTDFKHHDFFDEKHYSKLKDKVTDDFYDRISYKYKWGEVSNVPEWIEIYDNLIPQDGGQSYSDDYKFLLMGSKL